MYQLHLSIMTIMYNSATQSCGHRNSGDTSRIIEYFTSLVVNTFYIKNIDRPLLHSSHNNPYL